MKKVQWRTFLGRMLIGLSIYTVMGFLFVIVPWAFMGSVAELFYVLFIPVWRVMSFIEFSVLGGGGNPFILMGIFYLLVSVWSAIIISAISWIVIRIKMGLSQMNVKKYE